MSSKKPERMPNICFKDLDFNTTFYTPIFSNEEAFSPADLYILLQGNVNIVALNVTNGSLGHLFNLADPENIKFVPMNAKESYTFYIERTDQNPIFSSGCTLLFADVNKISNFRLNHSIRDKAKEGISLDNVYQISFSYNVETSNDPVNGGNLDKSDWKLDLSEAYTGNIIQNRGAKTVIVNNLNTRIIKKSTYGSLVV